MPSKVNNIYKKILKIYCNVIVCTVNTFSNKFQKITNKKNYSR